MTEADWKRLLNRVRDGDVVPVLGPQLLVDPATGASGQASVAEALLRLHGQPVEPGSLPACRELNEAFERLSAKVRPQDIYADVHELMRERGARNSADLPLALKQLAQISHFRLFVTLTPDEGIARALRQRCAVARGWPPAAWTAHCGYGTQSPGGRSARRSKATRAGSGAWLSAPMARAWPPVAKTARCASGPRPRHGRRSCARN